MPISLSNKRKGLKKGSKPATNSFRKGFFRFSKKTKGTLMNERGASQTAIRAIQPIKTDKRKEYMAKLKYKFFLNYWFIRLRPIFLIRNKLKKTMIKDLKILSEELKKIKKNKEFDVSQKILIPKKIKDLTPISTNEIKRSVSHIKTGRNRSIFYKREHKVSLLNNNLKIKLKDMAYQQNSLLNDNLSNYSHNQVQGNPRPNLTKRIRGKPSNRTNLNLRSKSLILSLPKEHNLSLTKSA